MMPFQIPDEILTQTGEVHQITFPRQGHTSVVAVLHTPSRKYIIKKTDHERYNEWLKEEAKALQLLNVLDVPIPAFRAYHEDGASRWLLMDYIEGVSVREALASEKRTSIREKVISGFAECLRQIHGSAFPPNYLNDERHWLDRMLLQAEEHLLHGEVDGSPELLAHLKQNRPQPVRNTFIHGDYTIDNILVNNGEIVGVIDWAGAAYGDPRYDIALAIRPKPHIFEEERDKEIFFQAYGKPPITDEEYQYFANGIYDFF